MISDATTPVSDTPAVRTGRATRPLLWLAYALAIALTVFTLFVRLVLLDYKIGDPPGLIFFLIPIIISAYMGGVGPGLVATGLTAILTRYFLLPPLHSFAIESTLHVVQWWAVFAEGVLISVLNEALHRSQRRAEGGGGKPAVTLFPTAATGISTNNKRRITFPHSSAPPPTRSTTP